VVKKPQDRVSCWPVSCHYHVRIKSLFHMSNVHQPIVRNLYLFLSLANQLCYNTHWRPQLMESNFLEITTTPLFIIIVNETAVILARCKLVSRWFLGLLCTWQGSADDFLAKGQLLPKNFVSCCADAKVPVVLRMQEVTSLVHPCWLLIRSFVVSDVKIQHKSTCW